MRVVALIGADGTGKTTQTRRLVAHLQGLGYRARAVRPVYALFDPSRLGEAPSPSTSPSPRRHRVESPSPPRIPGALFLLLGCLYAVLAYASLRLRWRSVDFLVCDRYFYQYFFDLAGDRARALAAAFPRPHTALWLDGELEVLRARQQGSADAGVSPAYFVSVLAYYRGVASELGFPRIDAGGSEETVEEAIWSALVEAVRCTNPRSPRPLASS